MGTTGRFCNRTKVWNLISIGRCFVVEFNGGKTHVLCFETTFGGGTRSLKSMALIKQVGRVLGADSFPVV